MFVHYCIWDKRYLVYIHIARQGDNLASGWRSSSWLQAREMWNIYYDRSGMVRFIQRWDSLTNNFKKKTALILKRKHWTKFFTVGCPRDSAGSDHAGSDYENISLAKTVGFLDEALDQVDRADTRRWTQAAQVLQILERPVVIILQPMVTIWNKDQFIEPNNVMTATDGTEQWKTRLRLFKIMRLGKKADPSQTRMSFWEKWPTK